jgi:hypothetical protein
MARVPGTMFGQQAFVLPTDAPVTDLRQGAQMGPSVDYTTWISNTPYVRRNLIALLIEAPTGFQDLENPEIWIGCLKTLVETQPLSITGLNSQVDLTHEEVPVGGAGEMQETPSDSKRTRSTPTFTWAERYNKPISKFLRGWISLLIMDPNTKYPAVLASKGRALTDILPDYNTMTVLFIEPDPTGTRVVEAWLCANMQPKSTGPIEGSRDLTSPGQKVELSIEFTAFTQVGEGVNMFAQKRLDALHLSGMNPNQHKAFINAISPDVEAAVKGYDDTLRDLEANRVTS